MAKKILIVDDDKAVADLLAIQLKELGYETGYVNDGVAALNQVHHDSPDLVILDVMLPQMDGFKVCRLLKFDQKFKKIPIILFTSLSEETNGKTGEGVGADAYFPKPFEMNKLLGKVKELIKD
ncbi:MAG: response regulator [Candidatus Margulisbacteria bacterium]|nr:response regulator [Candidatus Margulisiibacteriota bacterium]